MRKLGDDYGRQMWKGVLQGHIVVSAGATKQKRAPMVAGLRSGGYCVERPPPIMLRTTQFPSCDAGHIRALFAGINSFARLFVGAFGVPMHGRGQYRRHRSRCGVHRCRDP